MGALAKDADRDVARIAAKQQGMVKREQALEAGLSRRAIQTRIKKGRLWPHHRGVYSVGHAAKGAKAQYMAAVLACGEDSRVSGRAAAWLLSLISGPAPPPEISCRRLRRVPGVTCHESRLTGSRHTTHVDNIPTSRTAVALVEIASRLDDVELSRAVQKAIVKQVTEDSVRVALKDRPNYPGHGRLEAIFFGEAPLILSELERRFIELVRDAGLSLPQTNRKLDGRYVDCRWPSHQITVELLGFRFHNSRATWEADHARRREARARGDAFRAYTFDDVAKHGADTVSELGSMLASRRPSERTSLLDPRGTTEASRPRRLA